MPSAMRVSKARKRVLTSAQGLLLTVAVGVCGGSASSAAAEMTPGAMSPQRFVIDVTLELNTDSLTLLSARAAAPSVLAPQQASPLTVLTTPPSRGVGPTLSRSSVTPPLLGGVTPDSATPIDAAWSAAGVLQTTSIDRSPAAAPIAFTKFTQEIATRAQTAGGAAEKVYAARNHAPIWLRPTRLGRVNADAAAALASVLMQADLHGVLPSRYEAKALAAEAVRAAVVTSWEMAPADLAALELRLTSALLTYARDVGGGLTTPRRIDRRIDRNRPKINLTSLLTAIAETADREIAPSAQRVAGVGDVWDTTLALGGPSLAEALKALAPDSPDYHSLQAALTQARARQLALDKAPLLAVKGRLEPGETSPSVTAARARLTLLGYIAPADEPAHKDFYDSALETAVRQHQARNGLRVDGLIGARTAKALNLSGAERVARIIANLERARWMNFPLGTRHIRVNLPDMHAELIENGQSLLRTRTVIGKPGEQETPEFTDKMEYLVVNPSWHVPRSIAAGKLLEKLRQDPDHLNSQNMVMTDASGAVVDPWTVDWRLVSPQNFNFRIRQRPGRGNALGAVKFMFPNDHAVYLHDTSEPQLFSRSSRAFSHGCVRVADPSLLAERLLSPQIAEAATFYDELRQSSSEDRHVWFDAPIPVHIDYRTVWVDVDGRLQTRPDIYKRDAKLLRAMRKAGLLL